MKIKLFYNEEKDTLLIKDVLTNLLNKENIEITEDIDFDIGMAIGGDGTFLHMIMESNFKTDALYVGINNGTLGFLQEIKPNEIKKFISELIKNNYKVDELSYEEIIVTSPNGINKYNALNEVVVRDLDLRTAYLDIRINGEILENFVGDGIMVSTPTGSTSYNLSGGGSIIYNGINALEITPLAPINNYIYRTLNNSIIIPDNRIINVKPTHRTNNLIIFIDGKNYATENVYNIEIKLSDKKIKVIRLNDYDYTKVINNKFLQ